MNFGVHGGTNLQGPFLPIDPPWDPLQFPRYHHTPLIHHCTNLPESWLTQCLTFTRPHQTVART